MQRQALLSANRSEAFADPCSGRSPPAQPPRPTARATSDACLRSCPGSARTRPAKCHGRTSVRSVSDRNSTLRESHASPRIQHGCTTDTTGRHCATPDTRRALPLRSTARNAATAAIGAVSARSTCGPRREARDRRSEAFELGRSRARLRVRRATVQPVGPGRSGSGPGGPTAVAVGDARDRGGPRARRGRRDGVDLREPRPAALRRGLAGDRRAGGRRPAARGPSSQRTTLRSRAHRVRCGRRRARCSGRRRARGRPS